MLKAGRLVATRGEIRVTQKEIEDWVASLMPEFNKSTDRCSITTNSGRWTSSSYKGRIFYVTITPRPKKKNK